jgi:hypothetical protein
MLTRTEGRMYKRKEVFEIAARLQEAGAAVTVRAVRDRVRGPKGSFSTVGPLVAEWKKAANWRSRPPSPEIPASVQEALNSFAASLWAAARAEAEAALANARAEVGAERAGLVEVRADIGVAADALERRVQDLGREIEALRAVHREEVEALKRGPGQAGRKGEYAISDATGRKRGEAASGARKFWDEVMVEVATILRRQGVPLDAETILLRLSGGTREEAAKYDRLTPGVLAEKMGSRADRGRFFRRTGPGEFELLPEGRAA